MYIYIYIHIHLFIPGDAPCAPEVAFFGGYVVTGATAVTGYIYFTEEVQEGAGSLSFVDCGEDFVCLTADDFSPTSSSATFGTGAVSDGTSEYGMVRFAVDLPEENRRYRVTVPADFVKDTSSFANSGPYLQFSFEIEVGTVRAADVSDISPPRIRHTVPANGTLAFPRGGVVQLHFDEDVRRGAGAALLCLNANATSASDCEAANPTTLEIADEDVDRRVLSLRASGGLAAGQTIHVLLPAGAVKDTSALQNPAPALSLNDFWFKVEDEDVVPPRLFYFDLTSSPFQDVRLFFSEAVQAGGGAEVRIGADAESAVVVSDVRQHVAIRGARLSKQY